MKYYTGTGSAFTPPPILDLMRAIGMKLARKGVILRTGKNTGADIAFTEACCKIDRSLYEIYLPYQVTEPILELTAQFQENWDQYSPYMQKIMASNVLKLMGKTMTVPSTCVFCWSQDGCISSENRFIDTGYTGLVIAMAEYFKIPAYNLGYMPHFHMWENWVNE